MNEVTKKISGISYALGWQDRVAGSVRLSLDDGKERYCSLVLFEEDITWLRKEAPLMQSGRVTRSLHSPSVDTTAFVRVVDAQYVAFTVAVDSAILMMTFVADRNVILDMVRELRRASERPEGAPEEAYRTRYTDEYDFADEALSEFDDMYLPGEAGCTVIELLDREGWLAQEAGASYWVANNGDIWTVIPDIGVGL